MSQGERPTVGFAGLGRMGTAMARRILEAGFPLTVWNRSPERLDALTSLGARAAPTARELAESSDVVITMLADAEALETVLAGDDGALAGLGAGSILVDSSTVGPRAARRFAALSVARGAHWLDAPVSGSTALAEKGELTLMIGGDEEALERADPVFAAFSRKRFHVGPAGAGAAMKVAVQAVVAVLNEAVAESLVLAERAGIVREDAYDVLSAGAVAAPFVLYKRDAFVRPDETPVAFTVDLMRKDLRLVADLADELDVDVAAVRAADEILGRAAARGRGDEDFSSVAEVLREP